MSLRRTRIVAGATVLALTAAPLALAPVSAAPPTVTWGTASALSPTGEDLQLATSFDGSRAAAVWVEDDRVSISAATIAGNVASWGTATAVSGASPSQASNPDIAISADGSRIAASWFQREGGSGNPWTPYAIVGEVSGSTITFGSVQALAGNTPGRGITAVRMSADGTRATYLFRQTGFMRSVSSTLSGTTQTLGGLTGFAITGGLNSLNMSLALSRDGTKAAGIWSTGSGGSTEMLVANATVSGNTATWSGTSQINDEVAEDGDSYADIEMSDDGTVVAASWKEIVPGSSPEAAMAATASAGWTGANPSWGAVTHLSPDTTDVDVVSISLSADGKTALSMYEDQGSLHPDGIVRSRTAVVNGSTQTWGAEGGPSGTDDVDEIDVELSANGKVGLAVWEGNPTLTESINSAAAEVSGSTHTWGSVQQLTPTGDGGEYPAVGLSRGGCQATTAWGADLDDSSDSRSAILTCLSPTVTAVSPPSGPTSGGTRITITGTNFYPGATVTIGGQACTNVVVHSSTRITCRTPAASAGRVGVTVTNDDNQSASKSRAFRYIAPTPLKVTARPAGSALPVGKQTTLVSKVQSPGKKTVSSTCRYGRRIVPPAFAQTVCGVKVTSRYRVTAAPACRPVTVTVVIRAKAAGKSTTTWRRTWTTVRNRGDVPWLPTACLR